ncbi:hypothetical protein ACFSX9_15175 [Flavobacterium ardleyense]|uniref:Lipoprotein n=1 Tax=Flavobacterium ardleyense TaxID=2038737 RepID=A0ABW5ZB15_9FLAO
MKKIIGIFILAFIVFSCSENESTLYNPDGQGLIYFATKTSKLDIVLDGEGQVQIAVNSSSLSNVDRTVTIEVLATSTADDANYSLPSTVVIPANQYSGILTIDGVDVTASTNPELIILKIVSVTTGSNVVLSPSTHEVTVAQSCPVDPTKFIGDYLIEEMTPYVDGPTLSDGTVIVLKHINANTPTTERKFSTKNYPDYCSPFRDFFFNLLCGEVIVKNNQPSTCTCSADGMFFGPATTPATFDAEDDSEFFMTFTNDSTSDCAPSSQTTYKFTKQ